MPSHKKFISNTINNLVKSDKEKERDREREREGGGDKSSQEINQTLSQSCDIFGKTGNRFIIFSSNYDFLSSTFYAGWFERCVVIKIRTHIGK